MEESPIAQQLQICSESETYILKEYTKLASQRELYVKEILQNERWGLLISGVIWSWLSATEKDIIYLIYFIPAMITFSLGLRVLGLHYTNKKVSKYLRLVEKEVKLPNELGWENYRFRNPNRMTTIGGWSYWIILFVGNLIIAFGAPYWFTLLPHDK